MSSVFVYCQRQLSGSSSHRANKDHRDQFYNLGSVLTNNTTLVNQVHVIPGISDHEAVFIESSLRPMKNTPAPRKIFQYRKANYEGFKRALNDFTPDFLQKATSPSSDINSLWTDFKCKIHELMEKYIPQKLVRGTKSKKPWIDKHMKSLYRKRIKLF